MQTGKFTGKSRVLLLIAALLIFGCFHYWQTVSHIPHAVVSMVASHFRSSPTEADNPMLLHVPKTPGELPALSAWATSKLSTPGMVALLEHLNVNYVRVDESSHGIIDVVLGNRTDDEFAYISKHPLEDKPQFNNEQISHEDVLAAGSADAGICVPLVPAPPGVPEEEWVNSTASCHQDKDTKYVSRASFTHQVNPLDPGTKVWVAYQMVISGDHATVFGDTDQSSSTRTALWFTHLAFRHFQNGLVQMALLWRARQSTHLGEFLTNCSFVRVCSDYEGDQTNQTGPAIGMYSNALGRASLAANGVGPLSFAQIKSLKDPYLVGGPEYLNMGGDQFERALQFGYEFCCEGMGGGPWDYMTPTMAKNVAYEFYAYTVLHPEFLKSNPSWFAEHQEWRGRLREAGVQIPTGLITPSNVSQWVNYGRKLYPDTLDKT